MALPTQPPPVIRFGAFELDAANGELRKGGVSLKIHSQPLRVLLLLAERSGRAVTREEIQRCLWGNNTFVDFERGINFCVNQIRTALGDDAEKPRYVETLPRRGYRFIAPVKIDINSAAYTDDEYIFGRPTGHGFRSLGVLPFENLSGDSKQDYFADGMTEALITELGKISALRVISRQSMLQYKGTKKTVPQIASELKVDAVVEGSVLRVGNRVRVSVQLIEAQPERHLWADSYDRQMRDVLAMHGEVARTVAKEIKVTLTPEEEIRLAGARAINPAANEAYFRGRYFLNRRTKENLDRALADFQQAIELDPTFAPAYASLSEVYFSLVMYDFAHSTELLAKSQAASLKALELDDSLSAAHYTLAMNRLATSWDWSEAEVEARRAIEVNPSNASAHWWYSDLLIFQGRMTEAEAEIQRARELNPFSVEIYVGATARLYYERRYDEFIERCQGWVERDPSLEWNYHQGLGAAYVQMGRHEQAIAELREALKISPMQDHTATELANALAMAGKREEALKVLDRVEYVPWKTMGAALVHTGLGERNEAFRALERAIELRAPYVILLKVDPRFDSLRRDPRFPNLLRRMNLPD
jgi:TolB-like protein/DNA-binding winged helix-turn-helix (wHTH) protein/Tfp pilus assembly protein PilF